MPSYAEPHPMAAQHPGPAQPPNIVTENADRQSYPAQPGYSSGSRPSSRSTSAAHPEIRGSPLSQGSDRHQNRAATPSRDSIPLEMSTLEKIWGRFFENGKPTERLGQFLRGIAVHLVSPILRLDAPMLIFGR